LRGRRRRPAGGAPVVRARTHPSTACHGGRPSWPRGAGRPAPARSPVLIAYRRGGACASGGWTTSRQPCGRVREYREQGQAPTAVTPPNRAASAGYHGTGTKRTATRPAETRPLRPEVLGVEVVDARGTAPGRGEFAGAARRPGHG